VPSPFKAKLSALAAEIAVTSVRPLGTVHCPKSRPPGGGPPPQPQATTDPLVAACAAPTETINATLNTASTESRKRKLFGRFDDLSLIVGTSRDLDA
jgi:hypothetical protein